MLSLTDNNARIASTQTRVICIQIDVENIYTYFEMLAIHTMSSLLLPPSTLRELLKNIKRGVAQHPQLALPNDPNKDI